MLVKRPPSANTNGPKLLGPRRMRRPEGMHLASACRTGCSQPFALGGDPPAQQGPYMSTRGRSQRASGGVPLDPRPTTHSRTSSSERCPPPPPGVPEIGPLSYVSALSARAALRPIHPPPSLRGDCHPPPPSSTARILHLRNASEERSDTTPYACPAPGPALMDALRAGGEMQGHSSCLAVRRGLYGSRRSSSPPAWPVRPRQRGRPRTATRSRRGRRAGGVGPHLRAGPVARSAWLMCCLAEHGAGPTSLDIRGLRRPWGEAAATRQVPHAYWNAAGVPERPVASSAGSSSKRGTVHRPLGRLAADVVDLARRHPQDEPDGTPSREAATPRVADRVAARRSEAGPRLSPIWRVSSGLVWTVDSNPGSDGRADGPTCRPRAAGRSAVRASRSRRGAFRSLCDARERRRPGAERHTRIVDAMRSAPAARGKPVRQHNGATGIPSRDGSRRDRVEREMTCSSSARHESCRGDVATSMPTDGRTVDVRQGGAVGCEEDAAADGRTRPA